LTLLGWPQIWVNLPARNKMVPPKIQLLGEDCDAKPDLKLGAIPEYTGAWELLSADFALIWSNFV
jgi:redox-sensitive bicupin YhaK (pirin superfamily)